MPPIEFLLNGHRASIPACHPQSTLLDHVRGEGLTGAKEGCAEGECGACTVLLVAPHGTGSAFRAVNSCLMFLPMAAGHEFYTVEALAQNGQLCEVQQAMAAAGGSQCGYCTPGFVMSLFAEQYRPGRQGPCDPHQMGGNLCRCTGYRPIRDAALSLGPAPEGPLRDRLHRPAPPLPDFHTLQGASRFSRPTTVKDCLAILEQDPTAKLIAGGTDLGVESNLRSTRWGHLVSLEAIDSLRYFEETPDRVTIGAGLPLSDLLLRWTHAPPAVAECLLPFASPTIRNRATLGGNLGNASPIGDSAPLLMALDAELRIASPQSSRTVPVSSFFTGFRRTALEPGELITAVDIPKPFPQLARFFKVSKRRVDDISTVAAAMALSLDSESRVEHVRLAYGGVAERTWRANEAEAALFGQPWTLETIRLAQSVLAGTLQPITDHRGSAAYRLALAQSLLEKFWQESRQVTHG